MFKQKPSPTWCSSFLDIRYKFKDKIYLMVIWGESLAHLVDFPEHMV